jgi:hypothetical protein
MEKFKSLPLLRGNTLLQQNIPIKIVSIGENGSGAIQTIRLVK